MNESVVTNTQEAFLKAFGKDEYFSENFYLTGGTALAAFYLFHRYSEDLDFFSENEIDPLQVDIFLKKIRGDLRISKIDYQQSYNRNIYFLSIEEEILKIEFTYFPFQRIEKGISQYGAQIDSLIDIATNKLFSIYQRTQARDYVDLYFINKEKGLSVKDLIPKAKIKFDWHIDLLQLGTQFLKVKEAKDYPRMIKKVSESDIYSFFESEAKKLEEDIMG